MHYQETRSAGLIDYSPVEKKNSLVLFQSCPELFGKTGSEAIYKVEECEERKGKGEVKRQGRKEPNFSHYPPRGDISDQSKEAHCREILM